MTRQRIRLGNADFVFHIINMTLLTVLLLLVLYPLYFILIASVSDPQYTNTGQVWLLPKGFSFRGYEKLLQEARVWIGYRNTLFYTVVGTIVNLVMTLPAAYALSSTRFLPRNFVMLLFIFTMFFSGGLIPTYLVVSGLGLVNTVWAMIVPKAVAVWNIIIARTYFVSNVPGELEDAAFIDGCMNTKLFVRVILPISKPIIAATTLFYAVGHWNSYFDALIYLRDKNLFPLQLYLRELLVQFQMNTLLYEPESWAQRVMDAELTKYAIVVMATLPILVLYPFLQKYFVKGVMLGSLKG